MPPTAARRRTGWRRSRSETVQRGGSHPLSPATGRAFFAEIVHWTISDRSSPPSGCAPEAHIPAVCTRTSGGLTKQSPRLFGQALHPSCYIFLVTPASLTGTKPAPAQLNVPPWLEGLASVQPPDIVQLSGRGSPPLADGHGMKAESLSEWTAISEPSLYATRRR